nr:hypothetical protein [uncultured Parasphingorhabdus sp.]
MSGLARRLVSAERWAAMQCPAQSLDLSGLSTQELKILERISDCPPALSEADQAKMQRILKKVPGFENLELEPADGN